MWVKLGSRCPFVKSWTHVSQWVYAPRQTASCHYWWLAHELSKPHLCFFLFWVLLPGRMPTERSSVKEEWRMTMEKGLLPPHIIPIFWKITRTIAGYVMNVLLWNAKACSAETSAMRESIREGLFDQRSLGCTSQRHSSVLEFPVQISTWRTLRKTCMCKCHHTLSLCVKLWLWQGGWMN